MTKLEILNYIHMRKSKSVCVNRCLSTRYLGYVREITIIKDNILKVEFTQHGFDEGGICLKIYYDEFDKLVSETERYTGIDIENWDNVSNRDCYPDLEYEVNLKETVEKLKRDLKDKTIEWPQNGKAYILNEGYWKNIAEGEIDI